jgi:hypothetical protein
VIATGSRVAFGQLEPDNGNNQVCVLVKGAAAMRLPAPRRGNVFCRAAGERGPVAKRDEGREKPKGFLPARFRGLSRHKAAPDESGAKMKRSRLLSFLSSLSLA